MEEITEGAKPPKRPWKEGMRQFGQNMAEFARQSPGWIASFLSVVSNLFMTMLTWVAGCDLAVVSMLTTGEINKKAAIGLTMIFTIAVAAFAAGNAGGIFLSPALVVPFAFLWAGVIFSIDRAIIVFMDTKQAHAIANGNGVNQWSRWIAVGARFVIIFCMSYLTSTAVEMLIFKKEIEGVIAEKRVRATEKIHQEADSLRKIVDNEKLAINEKLSGKRTELAGYVSTIDAEINSLRQNIQAEQDTLRLEIQGRVGSGKQGAGPAAAAIRANISADSLRLAELESQRASAIASSVAQSEVKANEEFAGNRFKELDERLKAIDTAEISTLAQVQTVVGDGFKDRYLALQRLWAETPFLMFMVFLLLMIIESMPILLKLFSGTGLYEEALAQQYSKHRIENINATEKKLGEASVTHATAMHAINMQLDEAARRDTARRVSQSVAQTAKETELTQADEARRNNLRKASTDQFDSELREKEEKLARIGEFLKKVDTSIPVDERNESSFTVKAIKDAFHKAAKKLASIVTGEEVL